MGTNINAPQSVNGIPAPKAPVDAHSSGDFKGSEEDVSALEGDALVAALDDPARTKQAAAEITKRLEATPKANRFAYRVLRGWSQQEAGLLTPKDDADLADAIDGLRRCCFSAIPDLWAPGDRADRYNPNAGIWVKGSRDNTADFIQDRILDLLNSSRYLSEQELLLLALRGAFKNLPREIRFDLIDVIRKQYTRKVRTLTFLSFDATPALLETEAVGSSAHPNFEPRTPKELLDQRSGQILERLGEEAYQTLLAIVDFAQSDDCPETRQARKSAVTAAVANRLGVGLRRASALKKNLQEKMKAVQRADDPTIRGLYQLLESPSQPVCEELPEDEIDACGLRRLLGLSETDEVVVQDEEPLEDDDSTAVFVEIGE